MLFKRETESSPHMSFNPTASERLVDNVTMLVAGLTGNPADAPPLRNLRWDDKLLNLTMFITVTTAIFTSSVLTVCTVAAIQIITFGLAIVCIWDAVVQHSPFTFLHPIAILSTLWHHLRTELLGIFVSVTVAGILFGVGLVVYVIFLTGFPATPEQRTAQARAATVSFLKTVNSTAFFTAVNIGFGVAAMNLGIQIITKWNDDSIDDVTKNVNHSLAVALVGGVAYVAINWLRQRSTRGRRAQLSNDGQVSLAASQNPRHGSNHADAGTLV